MTLRYETNGGRGMQYLCHLAVFLILLGIVGFPMIAA